MKRLQNISVESFAIRSSQKELPASERLIGVENMGLQDVVSAHLGFINVVAIVPRVSVDEVV